MLSNVLASTKAIKKLDQILMRSIIVHAFERADAKEAARLERRADAKEAARLERRADAKEAA
jgi:hypothetical protein